MRLGTVDYYFDFYAYPLLVGILALAAVTAGPAMAGLVWIGACLFGVALWTLIEYLMHRFVLHHVPFVRDKHEAHHADQLALIGAPTWLSLSLFTGVVLVPATLGLGFAPASGLTAGLMLGYFWYFSVHHVLHHWRLELGTYGYRLKHRHALHHHFNDEGNFGVTTGFWDRMFGTEISTRRADQASRG